MRGLLVLLLVLTTGCFGTVSRWDGEGPIHRDDTTWTEVGGGLAGSILVPGDDSPRCRLVTAASVTEVELPGPLKLARLGPGKLYRMEDHDLLEQPIGREGLGRARVVGRVNGEPQDLAISGDEIAVATEKQVLAGKAGSLHPVWKGDPRAVGIDPVHHLVWVFDDGPVPTLVCLAEEDGKLQKRFKLPWVFHDRAVSLVLAEDALVAYMPLGPLKDALLVAPGLDATAPLLEPEEPAVRIWGIGFPGPVPLNNGGMVESNRVAPLAGNRFIALDLKNPTAEIALVCSMTDADEGPPRTHLRLHDWAPSSIEGVGWDEKGVVLVAGDQRVVIPPSGRFPEEVIELHPTLTTVRHGFNYAINVVLGVGELFGPVIVPAAVVALAGLVVATAPIWGAYVLCHT
jgi:hypothetical protein